jgi:tetratricopeptide (TPR) repeat protein
VTFGELLRQLRMDTGLTLEALAARSGIAVRTISDLELGKARYPRAATVSRLAWGLRLQEPVKARFEAAARGRRVAEGLPAGGTTAPPRTLPRDIASFTGRAPELAELASPRPAGGGVLNVHAIGGMAGVGKTALAVHAAHRLAPRFPDGQVFLRLDAHTPGRQPVKPADALASLLQTAGVDTRQVPPGLDARARLWRHWVAGKRLLLLLDDAVDSEHVRPLLPGTAGCLVLITSRRNLTALEDAHAIGLDVLSPPDAAGLLVRLADRPGLDRRDPAVAEIARLAGYLPLAVGMLARRLNHSPAWSPADLAADLAQARDRLEKLQSERMSVAAAFDLSYRDLTQRQQRFFRRLGLHPGADTGAWAAAALDDISLTAARRHLQALYDQNMIGEATRGRYRFHDLIRERARALAAEDPPAERDAALGRLLGYYQGAAAQAESWLARQIRPRRAGSPAAPPGLANRDEALAWARAERANLLACLDHATAAGEHDRVVALTGALAALLRLDGPWAEAIGRHTAAVASARRLGDRLGQANALDDLGTAQQLTGDYRGAIETHETALALYRDLGDRLGQANALSHLGYVWSVTDDYQRAAQALHEALGRYRDLGDRLGPVDALNHLAAVLRLTGDAPGAAKMLEESLSLCRESGNRQGEGNALVYLGAVRLRTGDHRAAARTLEQALAIYRELGHRLGQANALSYLGAAAQQAGDYPAAAAAHREALDIYSDLGHRLGHANALGDLGIVHRLTGQHQEATRAQQQALAVYRELGDQMGQANALNELGTLLRIGRDLGAADAHHQQALDLARRIDSSWDEAQALAGLGRSALAAGDAADARARLGLAREIFQRIGAPEAPGTAAEIDALGPSGGP